MRPVVLLFSTLIIALFSSIYFIGKLLTVEDNVVKETSTFLRKESPPTEAKVEKSIAPSHYQLLREKLNIVIEKGQNIYRDCIYDGGSLGCGRRQTEPLYPVRNYKFERDVTKYTCGFPLHYNPVNLPQRKCGNKKLIIGVSMAPNNFLHRIIFRKIYEPFKNVAQFFFLMGLSRSDEDNEMIKEENSIYDDIVQYDFYASYFNLTIQLVHVLKYLATKCDNYDFYLHHVDDTYMNINKFIELYIHTSHNMIAARYSDNRVIKDKESIYYIPNEIVPDDIYPIHPSGPGYAVNSRIIPALYDATEHVNQTIWIDDAYVGFLLRYINSDIFDILGRTHLDFCDGEGHCKEHPNDFNEVVIVHSLRPIELLFINSNYSTSIFG